VEETEIQREREKERGRKGRKGGREGRKREEGKKSNILPSLIINLLGSSPHNDSLNNSLENFPSESTFPCLDFAHHPSFHAIFSKFL
jgi:hypothetical protein